MSERKLQIFSVNVFVFKRLLLIIILIMIILIIIKKKINIMNEDGNTKRNHE